MNNQMIELIRSKLPNHVIEKNNRINHEYEWSFEQLFADAKDSVKEVEFGNIKQQKINTKEKVGIMDFSDFQVPGERDDDSFDMWLVKRARNNLSEFHKHLKGATKYVDAILKFERDHDSIEIHIERKDDQIRVHDGDKTVEFLDRIFVLEEVEVQQSIKAVCKRYNIKYNGNTLEVIVDVDNINQGIQRMYDALTFLYEMRLFYI